MLRILFIIMMVFISTSSQHSIPQTRSTHPSYELIYETQSDETTEATGAIKMRCRDDATAEKFLVSEVQFWLNRTSPCDPGLRERDDFKVVATDRHTISFNLSRHHEGDYTCGRRTNMSHVQESSPKKLTSFQISIPISTCINQKYTALSGTKVVLPCPFKPGALLQYYAVVWRKDSIEIAIAPNSKYRIDGATYALIIDPVSVNDTSSNYQCQMFVTNPITDSKQELQFYPQPTSDVSLSLTVVATNCAQTPNTATTIVNNHYYSNATTTAPCRCGNATADPLDNEDY